MPATKEILGEIDTLDPNYGVQCDCGNLAIFYVTYDGTAQDQNGECAICATDAINYGTSMQRHEMCQEVGQWICDAITHNSNAGCSNPDCFLYKDMSPERRAELDRAEEQMWARIKGIFYND